MKRNFDDIINSLKPTIYSHEYFVDFKKVFNNVDNIKYHLNNLNYLLGEDDFDKSFEFMFNKDPKVVQVLPILLAIRDKNILVFEETIIKYSFNKIMNVNYYLNFIYKTNLIDLFKDKRIRNFVDYVTGVEVGLDTNARKNRSGREMENLVERHIEKISNVVYLKQATLDTIKKEWNIVINTKTSDVSINKQYDFILKDSNNKIFLIETNFYKTRGSKLNETARSYSKLSADISKLDNVEFIWITDGIGWLSTKKGLEEAYNSMKHLYTIEDLNNKVLNKLIK